MLKIKSEPAEGDKVQIFMEMDQTYATALAAAVASVGKDLMCSEVHARVLYAQIRNAIEGKHSDAWGQPMDPQPPINEAFGK